MLCCFAGQIDEVEVPPLCWIRLMHSTDESNGGDVLPLIQVQVVHGSRGDGAPPLNQICVQNKDGRWRQNTILCQIRVGQVRLAHITEGRSRRCNPSSPLSLVKIDQCTERWLCSSNVSEDMARHTGRWMEGIQYNMGIWKGRNSGMCMGVSVCVSKCEKRKGKEMRNFWNDVSV